jgi:lysophospholipase L1-like esterase
VTAVVFYDENGNGLLDPSEAARVPDVELSLGGRSGRSQKATGLTTIAGVPGGTQTLTVRPDTLPPYYRSAGPVPVQVPSGGNVPVPLTLAIGTNFPNLYMGFGDSITAGTGSSDGSGYRLKLQDQLRAEFVRGAVDLQGIDGTLSRAGADRIAAALRDVRPAYVLVLYGTNDWNLRECRDAPLCDTVSNLGSVIDQTRELHSLPVLATLSPCNVGFNAKCMQDREDWIVAMNAQIRTLAQQKQVPLADVHAAFEKAGGTNLGSLFSDHVHPNDQGYAVLANELFRAITQPAPGVAAASLPARAPEPLFAAPASVPPRPQRAGRERRP